MSETEGRYSTRSTDIGKLIEAIFLVDSADALYRCAAQFVPGILPSDRVSISIYIPEDEQLYMQALHGVADDAEELIQGKKVPLGKTYNEYQEDVKTPTIWNPADPLAMSSESRNEKVADALVAMGMISVMNVPIYVGGYIRGTLNVASKNYTYQSDELLQLQQIATLVGIALERIFNYDEEVANAKRSRLYADHLELLNILGEKLSLSSTMIEALRDTAEFARRLVGARRVSYCELEPCKTRIKILGLIGSTTDEAGQLVSLENSGLADVLLQGKQLYSTDLKSSTSVSRRALGEGGLNHLWSFPVFSAGRTKGALNIGSPEILLNADDATSVLFTLSRLLGSTLERVDAQAETLRVLKEIERQARTDTLTGLPNRDEYHRRLDSQIETAAQDSSNIGVMFFDLDLFKNINDTLGHAIGDEMLCAVSRRVENVLRPQDTVARIGGDEFLVLLPEIESEQQVVLAGQRIVDSLGAPLLIASRELEIGVSIGAACYPMDGETSEELIKNADIAMYSAKESGRNQCQLFDGELSDAVNRRVRLESLLRSSIRNNELSLVFQPQFDCMTKEAIAIEALIRWNHPEEGMIPPDIFIPIAESCGFVNKITDWVVKNSLAVVADLRRYHPGLRVAVNVSASEFSGIGNLYNRVLDALHDSGLPAEALELELTETALLSHPEHASVLVGKLNSAGIQLAIDDFGTGYGSLSYLVQLPIDTIKIDRSFVDQLENDSRKQAVVSGIVAIANGMSLACVGEGVETPAQFAWLAENGCQSVQGYLICKPVSSELLLDCLDNLKTITKAA